MADALRQKIALGPLPPLPDIERSIPNSPTQSYHSEITEASLDEKDLVERQAEYLIGLRLHMLTISLCLSLFLSSLELTIIGTALVAITDSLQGFDKNSWIVTAYLLTYTGFLIILAKLSDIFGRKALMLTTLSFFVIFSVACGAAQTLSQLIVFRALQGIGGGGIYTMVFVIFPEMVPLERYARYAAILSSVFGISGILGPILGGLICDHSSWRWVFLLNAPAGCFALALIFLSMPSNFPDLSGHSPIQSGTKMELVRRIDYFGAILLLAASVLFISALEEGGTEYSWHSALVIVLLVLSFFVWIAFFVREKLQGQKKVQHESVFPWRLVTNRFWMGIILHAFSSGCSYLSVVIDLPQKFQVVYGDSSARAGYRMIPVLFCLPLAGIISGVLTEKKKVPPIFTLLVASLLQILGLALMTTISVTDKNFPTAHYGYEVLMGLGFGLSLSTLIMSVPLVSEQRDRAITMGAIAQFRTLGGSVGVSICTNVLNNRIKSRLTTVLSSAQINSLLRSSESLKGIPQSLQWTVQSVYAGGYNEQMKALTAFGAVAMLTAILMWERKPRRIP